MLSEQPFWEIKSLEEMTPEEWESLCDGCAKCCLHKIQDSEAEKVVYTNVVCRLLDQETCRCTDYEHRSVRIRDCVALTPHMVHEISWLPESCAYRRVAEGRGLAWWHPLVSGDSKAVNYMGISIRGKAVSELDVNPEDLEDMTVDWFS